jgi:hypothetical protein
MTDYTKRATVYLEPELYKGLKIKAAETSKSVSQLINESVRESLASYGEEETDPWLDRCFQLMDQAEVNSGGNKWTRDDLYDL